MKRFGKSILGVTLLEIMLVLAIAAMVIVMSVRYYQSATTNQQANQLISQLQAIAAAADSLAQGSGSYTSATTANLTPIVGASSFKAPWGSSITVTPSTSNIKFDIPTTPVGVCTLIKARLATNNHWSAGTTATAVTCPASTATWSVYYISNP